MRFNYDFEIASLIILTIILLHFILIRQFPTDKTRIFKILLLTCIGECGINIVSSICIANTAIVPLFWNELFVFAFFALEGLCSYLIFRYMMVVCEYEGNSKKIMMAVGTIPFLIFELMLIITPLIGFFYYFEDRQYYQGFGSACGFIYIAFYFALNIIMILMRRKTVARRTKVIVVIYCIAAITGILIQLKWHHLLLTSTGNVIILLMIYLAMQNPDELLDTVTGTGNENAFIIQMKSMMGHPDSKVIMTVYIRQFYQISTLLGYENSNMLLADIGSYLVDVCGKFRVFHVSVDTFNIFVESRDEAVALRQKLERRFAEGWIVLQNDVVLNMAIITQHYPRDFKTITEYRGLWQYLLEYAKSSGNQTFFETNDAAIEEYQRRNKVEIAVNKAIREKSFEVYYQPIYSLKEKRITSLEALVRLRDDELGYISPNEFIPLAEKDGNVIHIGQQVLEECCKFLARHILSNASLGIKNVHVNISAAQCLRPDLKKTVVTMLEQYHIPPSMISLEITERTAISAPKLMNKHMEELGRLGMTFSMDDYGSGNSNCSYLVQYPFQEVKIDKQMLDAYFESKSARIVLENEIRTIQKLGIPLVVEGVENREQSEEMERLQVDCIQGYYYGKPMPEMDCLRYIRNLNTSPEEYGK